MTPHRRRCCPRLAACSANRSRCCSPPGKRCAVRAKLRPPPPGPDTRPARSAPPKMGGTGQRATCRRSRCRSPPVRRLPDLPGHDRARRHIRCKADPPPSAVQRVRRRAGRVLVPPGRILVDLCPAVVQRRGRLTPPPVALPEHAGRQPVADVWTAVLVDHHWADPLGQYSGGRAGNAYPEPTQAAGHLRRLSFSRC
jgi:hypothetical protein